MRRVYRGAVCLFGCLLFAYLLGTALFAGKFPLGSYVNGVPAAFKSSGELSMELVRRTRSETFRIVWPDGSCEDLAYGDCGAYRPAELDLESVRPSAFLWPAGLFAETVIELDGSLDCDYGRMLACIVSLPGIVGGNPAVDAAISFSQDGWFVEQGRNGTALDSERVAAAVCDAIRSGFSELDLRSANCTVQPKVGIYDGHTVYVRGGADVSVLLDLGAGASWPVSPVATGFSSVSDDGLFLVDLDALWAYVGELAGMYDTRYSSRSFTTSTGEVVDPRPVGEGRCDFLGWEMDRAGTAQALLDAVLAGRDCSLTIPWMSVGAVHGANDIGGTYLEISHDGQHMWLYEDGLCTESTDVVLGLPVVERATPVGIYWTTDFYMDFTMTGDYGSSHCEYFIRVTDDGVGVHDSDWQDEYGGDVYITRGSHGCVNTPLEAMRHIFQVLSERAEPTPIIIW